MRVLVAMSGGVDSSVAAAILVQQGHEVVGATMKLSGGPSDRGCCSVAETEDARHVARRLGIPHHVFNFSAEFEERVVAPYVADHAGGRTPNPCVSCNRHLKFDRLLRRARNLGFDALATGHHARISGGRADLTLLRGRDAAKDQSYVLYMLTQGQLRDLLFPVGELTKDEVRERARDAGLATAAKPDSQDTCFVPRQGGREAFLAPRIGLHPGRLVDGAGREVGRVGAVELVTVGQRRGLGALGGRRYALDVDVASRTVVVGSEEELLVNEVSIRDATWVGAAPEVGAAVEVQVSAHGRPHPGSWEGGGSVRFDAPLRRVAPGQAVVLYEGERVLGGGMASGTSG